MQQTSAYVCVSIFYGEAPRASAIVESLCRRKASLKASVASNTIECILRPLRGSPQDPEHAASESRHSGEALRVSAMVESR
jgi:hypothetical protein